jgi:hypothetical protein
MNKKEDPLKEEGPSKVLNSLNNKNKILFHSVIIREGVNQK